MFYYLKTTLRERWPLFLIVLIILSTIGVGYMGAQSVSDRIVIQAKTDLEKNWRFPYDLLVLPKQQTEKSILLDGLVPSHSTLASYGGISTEDLVKIKAISGVEIAAPLSLIGYIPTAVVSVSYGEAEQGAFYEVTDKTSASDGLAEYVLHDHTYIDDYGFASGPPDDGSTYSELSKRLSEERNGYKSSAPPNTSFRYWNELMLVAIDPIEEDRLFSFSDSLANGNRLSDFPVESSEVIGAKIIPMVVLANQQTFMNETFIISKLELPNDLSEVDFSNGVLNVIQGLPKTEVVNVTIPTTSEEWKFKMANVLLTGGNSFRELNYDGQGVSSAEDFFRYSSIQYKYLRNDNDTVPIVQPLQYEKSNIYHSDMKIEIPRFRTVVEEAGSFALGYNYIDFYDSERVLPVLQTNWKKGDPVDIYTPPNSKVLEDGAGNSVQETYLLPLPYKDTYYTGAPDAITTMEAAKVFYKKEDPISSIRIAVKDVAERSDASQMIIEDIAKQIMDETGHHVEIMLGSAAAKVHVDLGNDEAGIPGLLEEGWQRAGVSWSIQEQIEKSNVVLFIYLLLVSFVFCYTVITHSLLRRSTEFAMLRAIGWSRRKIIGSLIVEIFALSLLALIPIVIANAKIDVLAWYQLGFVFLIILPVIGIGYFTGSRKALKLSPRAGLEGEGTQWKFMRFFSIKGLFTYVTHQLMRRPLRFGLLSIVLALTSFMVILFIATQKSLSDFLLLSFLGETIDLNLKGFQTVFLVAGIILTVSIVFLLLYLNITERRGEFFILRSIGWSLQRIQLYMGIEVLLVAVVGSIIGGIAAYALLTYYSAIWLPIWLLVTIVLTPPILMLLFSMTIVQSMKLKAIA